MLTYLTLNEVLSYLCNFTYLLEHRCKRTTGIIERGSGEEARDVSDGSSSANVSDLSKDELFRASQETITTY